MLLHWFSHSAQELSQCLGLRQPCLATFSGPWAHTILQWGWMFILLLYGVHEVIFLICYLSPAKGWDFFSQDVMVFCYPAGRKVTICVCYLSQSYSNDEHSPEPRDMLRSSPSRSHRHSVGFVPTVYNGTLPPSEFLRFLHKHARNTIIQSPPSLYHGGMSVLSDSAHRGLAPCPAVTAVMRNPVYTVRSHRVHTSNCPSVASQICHQHTHTRLPPPPHFTDYLMFMSKVFKLLVHSFWWDLLWWLIFLNEPVSQRHNHII